MGKDIYLTNDEKRRIINKNKCIGSGVDGSVYDMGHHILFKFYHNMGDYITIENEGVYDSEGVNITKPSYLRNKGTRINHKPINYIDSDGVILSRETAIKKAMKKQKHVKYTTLPQNIIRVNDKVAGCVYKKYDSIMGIYAASFLPLNYKKRILKRLYFKLKELLNNNIYPVTLAQKNDTFPFSTKDSNVLICKNLDPVIIDIDGISALYSDIFSKAMYERAIGSFSKLILEILSGIDIRETEEELDLLIDQYIDRGIDRYFIKKYIDYQRLDEKDIKSLLF